MVKKGIFPFLGLLCCFLWWGQCGSSRALSVHHCQRGAASSWIVSFVSATVGKIDNISKIAAKLFITGELCFKNKSTSVYPVACGCDKSPVSRLGWAAAFVCALCWYFPISRHLTPITALNPDDRIITPITVQSCFWQLGRG